MKKNYFTYFLIVVFIAIYSWFLYITIQYPYIGADVKLNERNQWIIDQLDNKSEFAKQLQQGDILLSVEGKNPNEYNTIVRWGFLSHIESFTVNRDGTIMTFHTDNASFADNDVLAVVCSAINLFIAWFLFYKAKSSASAKLLSFVFLNGGSTFISLGASIRGDIFGKSFISISLMFLPVLFLHFLMVFFKEKGNLALPYIELKLIKKLYLVIGLLSLIIWMQLTPVLPFFYQTIRLSVTVISFSLGILLNFYVLTYVFLKYRASDTYLSILIKWVWFSFLVAFFPFTFLSFLPKLFGVTWAIDTFYTAWLILLFPFSFAYLILTKQLYDLDVILRRMLFTIMISLTPSVLIVVINIIVFDQKIVMKHVVLNFVGIMIILSIILYSLEYYSTKLQRLFFPRKHYLQISLKDISRKLRSITTFRELKDIILTDIVNTLQVFGGAIVFDRGGDIEIISEGMIDEAEVRRLINSGAGEFTSYSLFEINRNEEYVSYLVMTEKKTQTKLGLEDNQWLNIIISYLAVSLENIYLIRKLTLKLHQLAAEIPNEQGGEAFIWFRKSMFELQEKERIRIATDLHDTTMQDILFVKRRIEPFLQQFVPDSNEYRQTLTVLRHLELINENLRQSCFELHPYLLQRAGLIQTVRKMIELEEGVNDFEVEFLANDAADIEKIDMEAKTQIFRMIQELLNNAKKHAKASRISIQVGVDHGWLFVKYEDDGIGFDMQALAKTDKLPSILNSGLGLEQMKSRILHLNGDWKLDSMQGEGVKMHITIPMKEGKTA